MRPSRKEDALLAAAASKRKKKIREDDPRWIPGLMGNKKWGPSSRGPENYRKGRGRPD